MSNTPKNAQESSWSTVDIGKARKERIKRFRAKRLLENKPTGSAEETINALLDIALDIEVPDPAEVAS
jgi:hypothetical protein